MKQYFAYDGPVLYFGELIDDCYKTVVCAENTKDAMHKIIHRWKIKNGYDRDDEVKIFESNLTGGFEIE